MGPEGICGLWRHALIALVAVRGEHGARHSVQQRALHAHLLACVCNTRVPQRAPARCVLPPAPMSPRRPVLRVRHVQAGVVVQAVLRSSPGNEQHG